MSKLLEQAIDARQTPEWGKFLESIGWHIEWAGKTQVFIRKIPFFNVSIIKIQHPIGPIPFQQIEQIAHKYRALFVLIEPHTAGYDEELYKLNGYRRSKMRFVHSATIKIDLRESEKKLFASFSENARRNIRKAQNNNLVVKITTMKKGIDKQWFEYFYKLLRNVGKIRKFFVPGYEEYYKKMTAFQQGSILLFAFEKEPIAVVWLAHYNNIVSYLQTGATKRGYETLSNYLLVWEGMKYAKKLGIKVFDFEAIYDPRYPREKTNWKGFSAFKRRFHGQVISYPPSWIKFHNRFFQFLYLCSTMFS